MSTPYFTVALTGQMGSGKTTAANYFAKLGATVLDADLMAHAHLAPHTPTWTHLRKTLPPEYFDAKEQLNKARLRQRLINDPTLFSWLESTLHPLIAREMRTQCLKKPTHYYLLVIPVLNTPYANFHYHRSCLIHTTKTLQDTRLQDRENYDDSMKSLAEKQAKSLPTHTEDVLDNTCSLSKLYQQIDKLHHTYKALGYHGKPL